MPTINQRVFAMNDSYSIVSAIAQDAAASHKSNRTKKKAKPTPSAWQKIWHDELRKYYPAYVILYSDVVASQLVKAVAHRGLPLHDVGPLLAWIVGNWPLIRRYVFSNNPKKLYGPEAPDMAWVIKSLPRIYGMFASAKPEHALAARPQNAMPNTPVAPLQPIRKKVSAPSVKSANAALLKPVQIDHEAAEQSRQRLGLKKWGE